jgi:hypothetical protein
MFASGALLLGLFVPLLDCDSGLPEPACIQVRMLFFQPGMGQKAVESVLSFGRRFPNGGFGNLRWWCWEYSIGREHELRLTYRYDFQSGKSLLDEAELFRGQVRIMRVSFVKTGEHEDAPKGIDPKLLEDVLRAIQDQKPPKSK